MTASHAQVYAALPFSYEEVLALAVQLRKQDISYAHTRAVGCAAEFLGVLSGDGDSRRPLPHIYNELAYWVGKCRFTLPLHTQEALWHPAPGQDPVTGQVSLADITHRILIPLFEAGVTLELTPAVQG